LIEKIKSLMSTSNENLALTKEQELILAVENGTEISTPINDDEPSTNYEL